MTTADGSAVDDFAGPMEQDDKVSAAALSSSSAMAAGRGGRASMRDAVQADGADAPFGGAARAPAEAAQTRPVSEVDQEESDSFERAHARDSLVEKGTGKTPKKANNVRRIRIERMMSKAELARRANLSVLTIDRVERGYGCRMDTKRKILEALGLSLADRVRVFGEEE
jgi:DNA-binding XRE family transcriptional regulator